MRGILAILAALVVGYLFLSGSIPGFGTGTEGATEGAGAIGDTAANKGSEFSDWYFSQGWAYIGLVAGVGAVLLIQAWKKIGSFGRGLVIFLAAVVATVIVTKVG